MTVSSDDHDDDRPFSTWRDAMLGSVVILLSPLVAIMYLPGVWMITRYYVWRPVARAWEKCADCWKAYGSVVLAAPHHGPSFHHSLAIALGRVHRRKAGFFVEQLRNPDPLLAAYAFKCLIRAQHISLDDIPSDVLERREEVPIMWADLRESQSLADFIRGYFLMRKFPEGC